MANKAQALQQDQWGRLPSELIELVLARLPFSRLLPFCYVCRRWQKFILSSRAHSLFLFLGDELVIRNLNTGVWERLSLQFLGIPVKQLESRLYLRASSGALVCFSDCGVGLQGFIVCNPFTRRFERVPLPRDIAIAGNRYLLLDPRNLTMAMLTDTAENSTQQFKLVLLVLNTTRSGLSAESFVYCSRDGSWARTAKHPEALKHCFAEHDRNDRQVVEHLGGVYWSFSTHRQSGKYGCFLVKYNVELNHWSWLKPQDIDCDDKCRLHAILRYAGKLFFLHNDGHRHQQFEIVLNEPDSSHTLALEIAAISLSSMSFCKNIVLKFLPRIDDSIEFVYNYAKVSLPAGRTIVVWYYCYGDGGPVMYYVGVQILFGNSDEEMMKIACFDEGELMRLSVGMEDMSGLITSNWEKWPKGILGGDRGGILTPNL